VAEFAFLGRSEMHPAGWDEYIAEVTRFETAKPAFYTTFLEVKNTTEANEETAQMRVYEVECGAVIILTAQDMQKAALHGAAAIKNNPHLIYVRAVHERG
jgi:hypothetical protein